MLTELIDDRAGNLTRQTDNAANRAKHMSYDHANRVTRVTNPATGETVGRYHYDDQGFRVRKTALDDDGVDRKETMFLYASMYFGVEIQKDVYTGEKIYNVLNNIYLNGVRVAAMVPTGEAAHFHTDQVDSVKVVTNDAGAVVSRMEYLPYGETWFQEGDDRFAPKYNSQELDRESGYYFYNARYYDPQICRFVTVDNIVTEEKNTQSWNRYTYVLNNPLIYKDPTGHDFMAVVFPEGAREDISLPLGEKVTVTPGHAAGIVIEKSKDGSRAKSTLYEQGNWGNTKDNNKEKIRKYEFKTQLKYDDQGNPTEQSMKSLLTEIHNYRKSRPPYASDNVRSAFFKIDAENTQSVKDFSEKRYKSPLKNREDYSTIKNNCIGFINDQARAGKLRIAPNPHPNSAIKVMQLQGESYNYNYKDDRLEK